MARPRPAELPAAEALYRDIPNRSESDDVTGSGTVDEFDLASFGSGVSLLGKWVFLTPQGSALYMRRYTRGGTAPLSASMQAGKLWASGETQEFFIDPNDNDTLLAVESVTSQTDGLVIEFSVRGS